jgi:hypothetical protein
MAQQLTVRARELPVEWQQDLGVDQQPDTEIELRVRSATAPASAKALRVADILDRLRQSPRRAEGRDATEIIRQYRN